MPKRGPNRKTRVVAAAGISAVVLVAGGGAVAYATSRGTAPTYVTASVGSYPVVQTLQATGTTEPSSAATVSFATSGIVATVPVAMGDKVTAGQVLATLDTTSLKYALASAQGQVANAELTLTQAESGQVSAASGTGTKTGTNGAAGNGTTRTASATKGSTATGSTATGSTATGSTATGSTATGSTATGSTATGSRSPGSSHAGSGSTASITAAQKLLLATVRHVDSLLTTTKADLALATTVCSAQTNPPPSPASSQTTAPTTTRASKPPTTTPPTTTPSGPAATCPQAQQLVLSDESKLFALQQGLFGQETALDKLLTSAAASTGTTPAGKTSTGTTPAGVASGTAGGTGATTVAVSAAQLAADQAAVDAANASLALAQQQLSQAIIVSPLTGVVSSVGLTVGQQAIAGSTTTAVDVIDPTGHGVTLSVDVTKIPQVKVGDKATVVPDGTAISLEATVSYVAAAPITSSGTAYNVQLEFTSNPTKLRDGIQTAVTITTAQTSKALAVPTSAVNHRGALDYVLIPDGSATKRQIITVGAIGAIYTQVTQGLTGGQRVVLADPNQPIPTNTITGRIARITGGVTGTTGVLGSSAGSSGTRPGG